MRRTYVLTILLLVSALVVAPPRTRRTHPAEEIAQAAQQQGVSQACSTSVTPQQRELERRAFAEINALRRQNGIRDLEWANSLADVAREHCCRMMRLGFTSHIDPERGNVRERLDRAGIQWASYGENIFAGPGDCVSTALSEWKSDPGHLQKLLDPSFTETGVGVAGTSDRCLLTAIFISTMVIAEAPQRAPEATECQLTADRDEVFAGDSVKLTWHIAGQFKSAKLTGKALQELVPSAKADGSFTDKPRGDTTYVLAGTDNNGKQFRCSVSLKVYRCLITADPERAEKPGDEITLKWKLVDEDKVIKKVYIREEFQDKSGRQIQRPAEGLEDVKSEGSAKVKPQTMTRYTLIGVNAKGQSEISCGVKVLVGPAPSCTLEEEPAKAKGKNITLSWTTTNAVNGELWVWNGTYVRVPRFKFTPKGEIEVPAPVKNAYYRLVVNNATGETSECSVRVEGGCVLKAKPMKTVKPGAAVTLTWNAPGANKRELEPGIGEVPASGTKELKPDKTTIYRLKLTPPGQVPSCSACVTVPGSGAAGDGSKTLDIPPLRQQTRVWCWLAVGEMVLRYYNVKQLNQVSYQCGIVGAVFPAWCGATCLNCIVGAGKAENITKILRDYPAAAGAPSLKSRHLERSLTAAEVKSEIDAERPIIAGISPSKDGPRKPPQHVALIVGYVESEGKLHLIVNDPYPFDETRVPNPYVAAGGENNHDGSYCIAYDAFRDKLDWLETFDHIEK